jgi:hypothetical protein
VFGYAACVGTTALVVVAGFVVFAAAALADEYFSAHRRVVRAMRAVAQHHCVAAPDGVCVRIVGRVVAVDRVVRAPLNGRRCVHFVSSVWVPAGDAGPIEVASERDARDYAIVDDSGRALVRARPSNVELALAHEHKSRRDEADPAQAAFLTRHAERWRKVVGTRLGVWRGVRFREACLEPGTEVAVVGIARWEDDPEPRGTDTAGYRDSARGRILVIEPPRGESILVSDDPSALGR